MDLSNKSLEPINGTAEQRLIDATCQYWTEYSVIFESINAIMIAVVLWLLGSIIIFTTKTGRWRTRAGSSSLASGNLFIICLFATFCVLIKLLSTEILYMLPRIYNGTKYCEVMADADHVTHSISLYSVFFFFWHRQTVIYQHPYVRQRVKTWPRIVGPIFVVVVSANTIAMTAVVVCFKSTTTSHSCGCFLKGCLEKSIEINIKNVLMAISLLVTEFILVALCVYPAFSVRFQPVELASAENYGPNVSKRPSRISTSSMNFTDWRHHIKDLTSRTPHKFVSPIQAAVKRTALSSIIGNVAIIIASTVAGVAIPLTAPVPVRQTIYNVGPVIAILCLPVNFGVWRQISKSICSLCGRTIVLSYSGNRSTVSAVSCQLSDVERRPAQ